MKDGLLAAKIVGILVLLWIVSAVAAFVIDEYFNSSTSLSLGIPQFIPVFIVSVLWLLIGMLLGQRMRSGVKK